MKSHTFDLLKAKTFLRQNKVVGDLNTMRPFVTKEEGTWVELLVQYARAEKIKLLDELLSDEVNPGDIWDILYEKRDFLESIDKLK